MAAWWTVTTAQAQDSLRLMSYNLLMYPDGTSYNRESHLQAVAGEWMPDVFGVCEMKGQTAASEVLTRVLQPLNAAYRMVPYQTNHSNPNDELTQLVYYNNEKLELVRSGYITTEIRDINHYTFRLRTPASDTLDVYMVHLKASSGTENEQKRLRMVQRLELSLDSLPPTRHVAVMGDFNLYRASEPAYETLTDTTARIPLRDPGRPGYWHNSSSFADLHTQSTHRNNNAPYNNFVSGGLDDRFDFIFLSSGLMNSSSSVSYRTGSYAAFGNNGNCFNGNINDAACSGRYSQSLRDHLFEMSDHLPVVATLTVDGRFAVESSGRQTVGLYPNPVHERIYLSGVHGSLEWTVFDSAGRRVMTCKPDGNGCLVDMLPAGMYYLQYDKTALPIPFVKE